MSNEQTHPLQATDKRIIDTLVTKETPQDFDLINLARLTKSKSWGFSLVMRESIIFLSVACKGWDCSLLIIKTKSLIKLAHIF